MKARFFKLNQWFSKPITKIASVAFGAALLSACSTVPETVGFEQQNTSFVRVAQAPEAFVGNQVRWGGVVARVENLEQDTLVEIVNLPLDSRARPLGNANTAGRFIARVQGFLDPMIYKQGKEITVVGILNDPMPGQIGQHRVDFPVVDSTGHHLWEKRPARVYVSTYSTWDPFWFGSIGYRWRYPYYGYPRYNYCPIRGGFYRDTLRGVRNGSIYSDTPYRVAPNTSHRVEESSLNHQPVDVREVERTTIRQRPQTRIAPTKPIKINRPIVPATPRRMQPKIHRMKIPAPTPPRNPRILKMK